MDIVVNQSKVKNCSKSKVFASIFVDLFFIIVAMVIACYLNKTVFPSMYAVAIWSGFNVLFSAFFFLLMGVDSYLTKRFGFVDFIKVSFATILLYATNLLYAYLFEFIDYRTCLYEVVIFYFLAMVERLLSLIFIKGNKKILNPVVPKVDDKKRKFLIIGAGKAGSAILAQMQKSERLKNYPTWFLDDSPALAGVKILGSQVVGSTYDIKKYAWMFGITNIVLATNNVGKERLLEIKKDCEETKCVLQILPQVQQVLDN